MTTTRRLWLGFGVVTAALVLSLGMVVALLLAIQDQQEARTIGRARLVAGLELEIGMLRYAEGAMQYAQTADPSVLASAGADRAATEAALTEYARLAATERQRTLAADLARLWGDARAARQGVLDATASDGAAQEPLERLADLSGILERLVDEELRPDALAELEAARELSVTFIRYGYAGAGALLLLGLTLGVGTVRRVAGTVEKTEAALIDQRNELRSTFEVMQDGVAVFDMEGNLVQANRALAIMHGYADADDMRQNLSDFTRTFELFGPTGASVPVEQWPAALALRGQTFTNLDLRVHRRDAGTDRFFSYSGTPIKDASGTQRRALIAVRDITESQRAQLKFDEQRTLFEAVLDAAPALIFVKDRAGRFRLANRALADVHGTTPEELMRRTEVDFNPSAGEGDSYNRDRAVIDSGTSRLIPEEKVTSAVTGESRWYQTVRVPLTLPGAPERLVLGIASDITERRRSDEARLASEERLRVLMEAMPDPVIVMDATGTIALASARIEAVFGYAPHELVGQSIEVLVPEFRGRHSPLRHTNLQEPLFRAVVGERADLAGRRKDGSAVPIEVTLSPVSTNEGLFVTSIVRDLTVRKALEDQLRQAQKMEAVGQLTGGIAHDLNNVLTVIVANSEMLAGSLTDDDDAREDLQELQAAATRGSNMIRQLLNFSRRGSLTMQPVRPGGVISSLSPMLRRLLPETLRVVTADATGDSDIVLGDAGAMEQMLVNLCTNARDAMPGGGTLRIECERTWLDEGYHATHPWVAPGAYVAVSVTDTGTGMDQETQRRLFEPFFTTKPASQGTGLGMAMVYGMMKQHGGMVHVYSEIGQGSTIKMYFPVAESSVADDARVARAVEAAQSGGHETVLLAEDEPSIRRTTKRALEGKGYKVLVAADGEEALELYRERREEIALVISDLVMPRLGGRQLAAALRVEGASVPVLFTSGYSPESAKSGAADFPEGVAFLQKPWTLNDLLAQIRSLLDGRTTPQS